MKKSFLTWLIPAMLLGTTILSVTACVKEEENKPPVQPEPGGGQEEDEDEDEKREVQPLDIREIIVTVDEQGKADGNHRFQKINETNFYIDDIKYRVEDGELVVCGCSPFFEGDAVIISALRYQGSTMKVTKITDGAFRDSTILKTCIVGTEVTTIGKQAFESCSNLEAVAIPCSVKSIGGNAFRYCYELYSVHITDLSAWCKIDFKIDEEIISYKYNYTTTSNPLAHAHHLYLDNQEVTAADDRDILDADVSQARRISLHESNKSFAISFSSLTFDGGVHGHYSYRLKGFEGDWTVLKPGEHSVRYTSLKPGTYTFELAYQVKPSDAPQVISINIDVAPYFWKSWWFLLLSAFILVVVMIWQLRQRMEKLRQKEAEKLLVPIRKAIDDADDPEQLQIRIQNILDNHEHLKNSFRRTVEADKQEAMRTRKSFVERATDVMEQNYSNSEFGINEFAEALGMSTSLVSKRLKAETGQSTSQFIRNYRLTIGRKLLLENDANRNVTEIAYKVGFNDPKYFTRCFTHLFGVSPSAYAEGDVKEDAKVDEN